MAREVQAQYYGDLAPSQIIDMKFTSRNSSGQPTTLSGSPAVQCYKDNSLTQSSTGISLTVDFDSITGFNQLRVDLSADTSFYSAGSNFFCIISAGTVGGTTVIGEVVGAFSVADRGTTIRKGVAFSNFPIIITGTGGNGVTGLNVTCQISKDSGSFSSTTNTVTEVGSGKYIINLTATETNANIFSLFCTGGTGVTYRTTVTPQQ